jgi:prepilin-type N-terminal cleavage/methylation domain-containing protein
MSQYRSRKSGFTLVELIVVIGLMAFLATISTGGYFAVTRGMAARGAVQDVASIIRFAQQACLIDQMPTAVLFYNYRSDKGTSGDAYGRAVAVRMSGRISYVANGGTDAEGKKQVTTGVLVDEFADWNQSFPHDYADGSRALGVRIYRMQSESDIKKGYLKSSSLMYNWVARAAVDRFNSEYMIGAGAKVEDWCKSHNKEDNTAYSTYPNGNAYRWGLPFHQANNGIGKSEWKIGDAYGMEIASFTLPKNYIFGTSAPKGTEPDEPSPKALVFWPDKVSSSTAYQFSAQEVTISMLKSVDDTKPSIVGKINSEILKDQD